MRKFFFLTIVLICFLFFYGCLKDKDQEEEGHRLTLKKGKLDSEEEFRFDQSFYIQESEDSVTIYFSNQHEISCREIDVDHIGDETTIKINLFTKDNSPIKPGVYRRQENNSLGPEIIVSGPNLLFNGADIGSVDLQEINSQKGQAKGFIDLGDEYGLKVQGVFEAEECSK
jgi:hypothetical protein